MLKPKVAHSLSDFRTHRRGMNGSIGFVPTMGSLHRGHLDLIGKSLESTDNTVVSIFVNPTQFAPGEDFESYPRELDRDLEKIQDVMKSFPGKDVSIFVPDRKEIYPHEVPAIFVEFEDIDELTYEGRSRPGFFRGVSTVVTKLMNVVDPTTLYLGQKDAIQCVVLERLVKEMLYDCSVVRAPTVRHSDGLAMSSRNVYLTEEERMFAPDIYANLLAIEHGKTVGEIKKDFSENLLNSPKKGTTAVDVLYLSICDSETCHELSSGKVFQPDQRLLVSCAVRVGKTRLIDNVVVG